MRIKREEECKGGDLNNRYKNLCFMDFLPTNLDVPNITAQTMGHYSWT